MSRGRIRRWAPKAAIVLLLLFVAGAVVLLPRWPALRFLAAMGGDVPEDGHLPESFSASRAFEPPRRVLVGTPSGAGPHPVMIVVHGVTEQGVDDGRLLRLGEAFRSAGFLTVLPEVRALMTLDPRDVDDGLWDAVIRALEDGTVPGADTGAIGAFAISVGGGHLLRVVATGDAPPPRALCLVGAADDLGRVARAWFRTPLPPPEAVGAETDPREAAAFARNMLYRTAARSLLPPEEAEPLVAWLRTGWVPETPPPAGRSEDARWLAGLPQRGPGLTDEEVERVLQANTLVLDRLSPAHLPEGARARLVGQRVHLLHGVEDPLVPLGELDRLEARLGPQVVAEAMESRLIGHTGVGRTDLWTHVCYLDRFFDAVGR